MSLLKDGRLEWADVAMDADTLQVFAEQIANGDAVRLVAHEQRELELYFFAVDLFVAHAVVVGVDPAGLIEQVFRLVQILVNYVDAILWDTSTRRDGICRCIACRARSTGCSAFAFR